MSKKKQATEQTVGKILDVSLKLFAEKGFEQTTILDIVAGLEGMTRGAFYHHFKSKEEVFEAIMLRTYGTHDDFIDLDEINAAPNGLEKMRVLLKQELRRNIATEQNVNVLNIYAGLMNNPRVLTEKIKSDQRGAMFFVPFIQEGMEDGSIKPGNPKLLAEVFMLFVNFWMFPDIYPVDDPQEIEDKGEMVFTMLDALGFHILDDELEQIYIEVLGAIGGENNE